MLKDTKPPLRDAFEEVEPGHFEADWIWDDLMVLVRVGVGLALSGVMGWLISPTWLGVLAGILCYALGYHAGWLATKGAKK